VYYQEGSSVILTYGYAGGTQESFGQVQKLDVRIVKPGIISRPVEYPLSGLQLFLQAEKKFVERINPLIWRHFL